MDEKLKPCPFCGVKVNPSNLFHMHHENCLIIMMGNELSDKKYYELWQSRPIEDALRKQLDELQRQLDEKIPYMDKFHKERDILQYQLDVAKEALNYIPTIMMNDGRAWNVDVIEERIQMVIDNALAEIEKIGSTK